MRFHTRFFPALVSERLRGGEERRGFHSILELHLALVACLILLAVGVPLLVAHRSLLGVLLAGPGGLGFAALVVHSLASRSGERVSFEGFLVAPFLFFLTLGPSVGLLVGTLNHAPLWGAVLALTGLVLGYAVGILAGLGVQALGWMAAAVCGLAWLALLGLLFMDLIFLSIALFA